MSPVKRVASLVPSATEMLFALGLGEGVVGVTHECDFPSAAEDLPQLTRSVIPEGLTQAEIDVAVRELTGRGEALYELDEQRLRELDVDLIVTQAVCEVCAVSYDDVVTVAERLPSKPRVVSQDPSTLADVLSEVERLGEVAGVPDAGRQLRASLEARLETVAAAVASLPRPRVAALEWLEPPYIGGHWVPEMIRLAGGEDPLAAPGDRSRVAEWAEIAASHPEVAVVMPCGLYADEAREVAGRYSDSLRTLGAGLIFAVDAASTFSRPGPRLIDGVELLAHLLHPEAVPAPPGIAFHGLELSSMAAQEPA